MNRLIPLALAVFAPCAKISHAQLTVVEEGDTRVYRMTVTPAVEPTPRLSYRLVPADNELVPGNAATYYYRTMGDFMRDFWRVTQLIGEQLVERGEVELGDEPDDRALTRSGSDAFNDWSDPGDTLLDELPLEHAKRATELLLGWRTDQLREAAARERCDWDLGVRRLEGTECVEFLLPEFQHMRALCRTLCLDARVAIAEGRLDDALESLRLNTSLGLAAAEPPLYVCRLIGGAIVQYGRESMMDFICHPQAPSLYWALADLPRPLVDRREAIRFESGVGPRMYELIRRPETADRTDDAWGRLLTECLDSLADLAKPCLNCNPQERTDERSKRLAEWVDSLRDAGRDHPGVRLATERLRSRGYGEAEIEAMPVGRVLAIDAAAMYRVANDAVEAAFELPWAEGAAARDAAVHRLNEAAHPLSDDPEREVLPVATLIASSTQGFSRGIVRQERDTDALRLVEALRLHAGVTGELPASLDEVTSVPIPRNPATGESFSYRLADGVAVIDLPASDRLVVDDIRYEVRLAD